MPKKKSNSNNYAPIVSFRIDEDTLKIMDLLVKHGVAKNRNQLLNKIVRDFYHRLYCELLALEMINKVVGELENKGIKISRKDLKNVITSILPVLIMDISMYYDYLDLLSLIKKRKFQEKLLPELQPLLKEYIEEVCNDSLDDDDLEEIYEITRKCLTELLGINLDNDEQSKESSTERKIYEITNPKMKNAIINLNKNNQTSD